MVDFRKGLLLLSMMVATTGLASAQFQNPLACTANAGSPPIARAEGVAEEVGQVVIICTGGTPTAINAPIPTVNVQVFLNTNVTSRILNTTTNGSEALLLIDEPAPAIQTLCAAGATCPVTSATGIGTGNYVGGTGHPNVWQGVQAAANSIAWLGVPIDPPGTAGNRIIRLANIRANANQLGVSSTLIPSTISESISITGTGAFPLSNPNPTVAYVQSGLGFSATTGGYNQCEPGTYTYTLQFKELFGTAFRSNSVVVTSGTATPITVTNQSQPGSIYNTESMFSNSALLTGAGVATQGTRLIAQFSNVPANVSLSVPSVVTSASGDIAYLVTGSDANGAGGSYSTASSTVAVTLASGAGFVVYEVGQSNPATIGTVSVPVSVTYGSDPLPGLGSATVAGNYAPTTTVFTASSTAPVPRFVSNPTSATTFTINSCQTNLLFPFVTNAAGFDTGIAISNTSSDPYGTVGQTGTVTVYYYGPSAPDAQTTSGSVAPGSTLVFTLSSGGGMGIAGAPGFQGYMIARCNFQYGHGYAFISDVGATKLAQGYIALVLDADKYVEGSTSRTGTASEPLNN